VIFLNFALDIPFPAKFMVIVKQIYTRMFRIFAIIYTHHFSKLEELGAVAHLNTSFKHYLFFVWEFDLVDVRETDALREITQELKQVYIAQGNAPTLERRPSGSGGGPSSQKHSGK
jgi:hypothetical protein